MTGYLKLFEFNKKKTASNRSNLKLDFQLSNKSSSNIYYAIGGYVSSNYLGFNNLKEYTSISKNLKPHSEIYAKIGFLINSQSGKNSPTSYELQNFNEQFNNTIFRTQNNNSVNSKKIKSEELKKK